MPFLETFNPFVEHVPNWPFGLLPSIASRACAKLTSYPLEDLQRFAHAVQDAIEDRQAIYVETETAAYIDSLADRGGWELGYYPAGAPITESGIRWLLEHWPEDADEEPSLPKAEDLADDAALEEAYSLGYFDNPFEKHFQGDWGGADTECLALEPLWALLALMKVEAAVEVLREMRPVGTQPQGPSWTTVFHTQEAANFAMEALGALAEADAMHWRAFAKQPGSAPAANTLVPAELRARPPSRRGNEGRTAIYGRMRAYVLDEAREASTRGDFNPDQFAAAMQSRLAGQFFRNSNSIKGHRKGDPLTVKIHTIRTWLRDAGYNT